MHFTINIKDKQFAYLQMFFFFSKWKWNIERLQNACNRNVLILVWFFFVFFCSSDDLLSLGEFTLICRALFRNDKGHIYVVPDDQLKQMFAIFDKNQDGFIDRDEFQFCWNHWIKTVGNSHSFLYLNKRRTLLVYLLK